MENADIILNILISLLLVITIIFCFSLSRRISRFNSNKKELARFLLDFNDAIKKAEGNINMLKEMGTQVDDNLKSQIKKARFLANDLSFLSEKGESVAQNLESTITISRDLRRKANTSMSPSGSSNNDFNDSARLGSAINTNNSSVARAREILSGDAGSRPNNANSGTSTAGPASATPQLSANRVKTESKRQALDALLSEIAKRKSSN